MNSNLWPGSKKDRGKKQTTEGLLWAEIHRCGSFDIQKKKKKHWRGHLFIDQRGARGRDEMKNRGDVSEGGKVNGDKDGL